MAKYKLHNYFRSSTSYRVRAALNFKGLPFDYISYHLRKGEQRSERYLALNPQGLVPALQVAEDVVLTQSLAIIEYLEEVVPEPPLLPKDALGRARVRSLAMMIACDIHPLNNLRVLNELRDRYQANDQMVADWFTKWVTESFVAYEERLHREPDSGAFSHGDSPTLADICLVSQVINNRRFGITLQSYPLIQKVFENCMELPAFKEAVPELQPDAE